MDHYQEQPHLLDPHLGEQSARRPPWPRAVECAFARAARAGGVTWWPEFPAAPRPWAVDRAALPPRSVGRGFLPVSVCLSASRTPVLVWLPWHPRSTERGVFVPRVGAVRPGLLNVSRRRAPCLFLTVFFLPVWWGRQLLSLLREVTASSWRRAWEAGGYGWSQQLRGRVGRRAGAGAPGPDPPRPSPPLLPCTSSSPGRWGPQHRLPHGLLRHKMGECWARGWLHGAHTCLSMKWAGPVQRFLLLVTSASVEGKLSALSCVSGQQVSVHTPSGSTVSSHPVMPGPMSEFLF